MVGFVLGLVGSVWAEPAVLKYRSEVIGFGSQCSGHSGSWGADHIINGDGMVSETEHRWFREPSTDYDDGWWGTSVELCFDRAYAIEEIWIWNGAYVYRPNGGAIRNATISSWDGSAWVEVWRGELTQTPGGALGDTFGKTDTINLGGVVTERIKFERIDTYGSEDAVLSEIRFYGSPGSPRLQFETESSGGLEEVSPAVLTVTLGNARAGESYTVDYAVVGGSAARGVDYTLDPGILTFGPGEIAQTIYVDIADDGADEEDETIVVALSNPTTTGEEVVLADPAEHTYTILDARSSVGFEAPGGIGTEDSGTIEIPVSLASVSDKTITVDYDVTGGTATGGGVDYTLAAGTLTFNPGETGKSISVEIVDDSLAEDPETVVITLSNQPHVKLGIREYTIEITDPFYPVTELLWGTDIIRANANSNHGGTWEPRNTINRGGMVSADEHGSWGAPGDGIPDHSWMGDSPAGVWIEWEFARPYRLIEMWLWNGAYTGRDNGGSIKGCTIEYYYKSQWHTLTSTELNKWGGGISYEKTDVIDFGRATAEKVRLMVHSTYESDVSVLGEVRFYISEPPGVAFSRAYSGAKEDEGPVVLSVDLMYVHEEGQTYTVDYAVTGGTAGGGGVDYTLAGDCDCDLDDDDDVDFSDMSVLAANWVDQTPGNVADVIADGGINFEDFAVCAAEWERPCTGGTLVFNPGETSKEISIDIVDDGLNEEDETIIVSLSDPTSTGAKLAVGVTGEQVHTIVDPRPGVGFDSAKSVTREDFGTIDISVSVSVASDEVVTVDYYVGGGTATGGGVDYTLDLGTLTFDPGELSKTITIVLAEDDEIEGEETIMVTLSNASTKFSLITEHTAVLRDPWTVGVYEVFKVDLACPRAVATMKEGWVALEGGGWCDGAKHDGRWISNIADTGIDAYIDNVPGGGAVNLKTWGGEPICNTSFMQIITDVFGPPAGSIKIVLSGDGLVAGEYWLYAFHNWPEWSVIPEVTVSGAGVTQLEPTTNVAIQKVLFDGELIPSVAKFHTDGSDSVTFTYHAAEGAKAVVNAFALFTPTPPEHAIEPRPKKGATDVSPDVVLSWTAGTGSTSHDVYVGIDEAAVESATPASDEYKGNQTDTTYVPGGFLDFEQKYYWRVDEVGAGGTVEGNIWNFTVADGKAFAPSPSNHSGNISPEVPLIWTAGVLAETHDVYLGVDPEALELVSAGQDSTTYDPGFLLDGMIYYWRVDEVGPAGTVEGDVWDFSTEGLTRLRVDLALPAGPATVEPWPGTLKEGWTPYVAPRWFDMYMHDAVWEKGEGGEGPPPQTRGLDGTGVHVALGCGNIGTGGFHVHGMCRCGLAGGCPPTGNPAGEPIANGFLHNIDWAGERSGDILMRINGLPPGEYELIGYHNHWEPRTQATRNCLNEQSNMPPIGTVVVMPLPEGRLPEYGKWNFTPGTGIGVESLQDDFNIKVTSVTTDADVATSHVRFRTNGADVLVIYGGLSNDYADPARPGREGHKAILNAFEIRSPTP